MPPSFEETLAAIAMALAPTSPLRSVIARGVSCAGFCPRGAAAVGAGPHLLPRLCWNSPSWRQRGPHVLPRATSRGAESCPLLRSMMGGGRLESPGSGSGSRTVHVRSGPPPTENPGAPRPAPLPPGPADPTASSFPAGAVDVPCQAGPRGRAPALQAAAPAPVRSRERRGPASCLAPARWAASMQVAYAEGP